MVVALSLSWFGAVKKKESFDVMVRFGRFKRSEAVNKGPRPFPCLLFWAVGGDLHLIATFHSSIKRDKRSSVEASNLPQIDQPLARALGPNGDPGTLQAPERDPQITQSHRLRPPFWLLEKSPV